MKVKNKLEKTWYGIVYVLPAQQVDKWVDNAVMVSLVRAGIATMAHMRDASESYNPNSTKLKELHPTCRSR